MNRVPVEKSYGRMGRSLLSVSVAAEGPSPWPAGPWHFQHSIRWNSWRPRRMLSAVGAGSIAVRPMAADAVATVQLASSVGVAGDAPDVALLRPARRRSPRSEENAQSQDARAASHDWSHDRALP